MEGKDKERRVVALVTGGSGDLGGAICRRLARDGLEVWVHYHKNSEKAREVVACVREGGGEAFSCQADLTDRGQTEKMIREIMTHSGPIGVLVNNAGQTRDNMLLFMPEEDWDSILDTNMKGVFLGCQAAARIMIPRKQGSIINIASLSGSAVNVPQKQAVYNTSKAGVVMLTKSLAVEWAPYGIRVNSISPGYIKTEMTLAGMSHLFPAWESLTPMGRLGEPEELRGAVLFLASDASSYVTGHDLVIDGGYTAR